MLVAGRLPISSDLTRVFQAPHIFHLDHRQWTHVGLYIGNDYVIDKDINPFSPWRVRELHAFCGKCDALVRRVRIDGLNLDLEPEIRARILHEAFLHLKKPYAWWKLFWLGIRSVVGGVKSNLRALINGIFKRQVWQVRDQEEWVGHDGMLCTDLIDVCLRSTLRYWLVPRAHWTTVEHMLTPAALSWSPALEDVMVGIIDVRSPLASSDVS